MESNLGFAAGIVIGVELLCVVWLSMTELSRTAILPQ